MNCFMNRQQTEQEIKHLADVWTAAELRGDRAFIEKTLAKEAMQMAARFGRLSPHPRLGSVVELDRRYLHRTLDLTGIGKALARKGIATEQTPPTLL